MEPVPTRVARAGWDEHRFFGWRVFGELAGNESVASLVALAATGRRFDPATAAILDDVTVVWTLADPRIWPLKLCRLVASRGSLVAGAVAGLLSLDNPHVGVLHVTRGAAEFLRAVRTEQGASQPPVDVAGALAAVLARTPHPSGFGVPLREVDERVAALRRCVQVRSRDHLPWWRLFEEIATLQAQRGVPANITAAYAAVCLDLGLDPEELSALALGLSLHVFLATAREGALQQHPLLRALPPEAIRYTGPARRSSPRALQAGRTP